MSQQINLFNPVFMTQKKYFSVTTMLQALGLILLGSAVFYAYAVYQVDMLSKQTEEMNKRHAAEQTRLANYTRDFAPERSRELLQQELKQLEAEAGAQQRVLDLLKSGAIGNTEGYSEYLRAFARQSLKGMWLTGFDITGDGARMRLTGATTDAQLVPAYIRRLGAEKVMRGKTFAAFQMQQPKKDASQPAARFIEFNLHSEPAEEKK